MHSLRPQTKQLKRMLLAGKLPKEIHDAIGVDKGLISYYRKQLGISPFRRGAPIGVRGRNKKNIKIAEKLRSAGLTYQEIGVRFGVTRQRVHQLLSKNQIGKIHGGKKSSTLNSQKI